MNMEPVRLQAVNGTGIPGMNPSGAVTPDRERALVIVARLREHIARIETGTGAASSRRFRRAASEERSKTPRWTLGIEAIDQMLPLRGLAWHGIHDVTPFAYGDFPAACGFTLALALRRLSDAGERRPLLWCRLAQEVREYGRLYGHGLERLGLSRQRLLTVTLQKPVAQLWTMEEALKSGALAVVIGDMPSRHTDLTVTRRLALAAQAGRCAGLMVFTGRHQGATASHTRWRVRTARSPAPAFDTSAPGAPAWDIELMRARSGRSGAWTVIWQKEEERRDDAAHRFHLAAGFSSGALHPGATEGAGWRVAAGASLRAG